MPKSLVIWVSPITSSRISRETRKIFERWIPQNIQMFWSVKSQAYPPEFTKQEKLILRKFFKKLEYDQQKDSLFYIDKQKDGSTLKRLVIKEDEKWRVFEKCHFADFSGHAGRDNTIKKVK